MSVNDIYVEITTLDKQSVNLLLRRLLATNTISVSQVASVYEEHVNSKQKSFFSDFEKVEGAAYDMLFPLAYKKKDLAPMEKDLVCRTISTLDEFGLHDFTDLKKQFNI